MGDAQWTSGEASVNFDMAELYSNFVRTMGDTVQGGCRQPSPSNNREVTPTGVVGIEPAQVPVDYQCCDFQNVTFGCSETGTNFSRCVTRRPLLQPGAADSHSCSLRALLCSNESCTAAQPARCRTWFPILKRRMGAGLEIQVGR